MKVMKTVLAFDRPFVTITEDNTVWVSVESLCEFLGLNYPEQVMNLTGESSLKELGLRNHTTTRSKMIMEEGRSYLCVPLEDVSLFAATSTLEDLSMIDNQRRCRDDLPVILAGSH